MMHLLFAAAVLTMRVDYYHTGNATQEHFSLDRVVVEPLAWPGDPSKTIDTTLRGKYFFEVVDEASRKVIYSRGFASVYGEWETTAEAKAMNRTFSESLRFPGIEKPARIVLKKRDAKNAFVEVWTTRVDPADKFIVRAGALASVQGRDDRGKQSDRGRVISTARRGKSGWRTRIAKGMQCAIENAVTEHLRCQRAP